jgi:DNA polymerase-3 subunit epsilon
VLHETLALRRPLVVFDLEATGLFPARDRIVEIAALKIHPDGRRETFHRRLNPAVPIPPEATRIHGIADADVARAPSFAEVAPDLVRFLAGCDLAGYNVERFDLPMLQFELARAGVEFDFLGCDVLDAQAIFFSEEGRTLSDAVRFYAGEELEQAHSALADATATARVLEGQLQRYAHLPRDVKALAERYRPAGTGKIDPEGKLVLKEDVPFINFGQKHRGKSFDQVYREEPSYFEWILRGDFSLPIKRYVERYLSRMRGSGSNSTSA